MNSINSNITPSFCKNVVPIIKTPELASLCIYPDSSYQSNRKLSPDFFLKESQKIIKDIAAQIQQAQETGTFNRDFFNRLVISVGKKRGKLALEQKSEAADLFGIMRKVGRGDYAVTPLGDDQYREYQQKFLEQMRHLYKTHGRELANEGVCIQEKAHSITSYFCAKIFSFTKLLKTPFHKVPDLPSGERNAYDVLSEIQETLIEKGLSKKQRLAYQSSFVYLYANTTLVTEDEKVYPGSESMAFLPKMIMDSKAPIWADSRDHLVRLCNPKAESIPESMGGVYESFSKALQSTTKDKLAGSLSTFQYLFAHITPYGRGSASIAEWFTQAICDVKNYLCTCRCGDLAGKCSLDLAALTSLSIAEYADIFSRQMSLINMGNQTTISITGIGG